MKERDYMYSEFPEMECPPLKQIQPGDLVLANKDGTNFRGSVTAVRPDGQVKVISLDNGAVRVRVNNFNLTFVFA